MIRLCDFLFLIGATSVGPGSIPVLGQTQGVTTVTRRPELQPPIAAKKQEALSKAEVAKRQTELEGWTVPKAAVKAVVAQPARVRFQPAAAVLERRAAQRQTQMWPMFRAEYYFIRNACDLSADQRKALARLGESTVKAAARQFIEAEQKDRRVEEYPDPRKLIEDELAKALTALLSPGQQARYKEEIEKRAASRKQLVIDNMVATLDQNLVLGADQRTRLVEALSTNWKNAWGPSLQMLRNIDDLFPNIPDQVVVPILTDRQREVWRWIPKNQNVNWGSNFARGIVRDDPLDDPELAEAQKEAEAKNKK
jgi:hypothetical protein